MTDLTYTQDGMFTRFFPVTDAGVDAWRVMAEKDGVAAVLSFEAARVIAQLRKAGYSVAKAKKEKISVAEIDSLLAELGV